MVREYSADGQQPPRETGDGVPSLDPHGGAANLTQELAQLLAASIAQNQPGKRGPGTPTGSELASLAALVSAQRPAVPSFKDGLSSLSYTPAAPRAVPPPGGSVLIERHDDEPMPIPSTWREPTGGDDDRWYRQQVGAAALGLAAGLVVVIPSVLWLSGFMGGPQARPSTRHAAADIVAPVKVAEVRTPDVRTAAEIRPVKVQIVPVESAAVEKTVVAKTETASQFVASVDARPAQNAPPALVEQPPVPIPAPVARAIEPPRPRAEDVLVQVERRIGSGDILGAREFLLANEGVAPGPMTFALAETYDPIMLAAWGTRGVSADVVKARSLYARARDLGEARAQVRLDLLR